MIHQTPTTSAQPHVGEANSNRLEAPQETQPHDPTFKKNLKFRRITLKDTGEVVDYVVQVPGFPRFFVSADGRIFRKETAKAGSYYEVSQVVIKAGYAQVRLTNEKTSKMAYVHHIMVETFKNPPPGPGYQIDHLWGDKLNNHIANLRLVTPSENVNARKWQEQVRRETSRLRELTPPRTLATNPTM